VWARTTGVPALIADGEVLCELGSSPGEGAQRLRDERVALAPKALALTLFVRMFVADLFIHGIGGGRYDKVTDDVARRYFGVELPKFVVASLTAALPLGVAVVGDAEIEEATMALNRFEHNPDQMLASAPFASAHDQERAHALSDEKRRLVGAIASPDADKKAVGARIREVNQELAGLLAPLKQTLADRVAVLERARDARDILTDRTYSFCVWDPAEISRLVDQGAGTRAVR
jgi:hypothetical protein